MKKLLFIAMVAFGLTANAQDGDNSGQTSKGKWLIEANTGFGAGHAASTGFYLASTDGSTEWNLGAEGGYFVADDLAVKVGLGYGSAFEAFSYKVGAKYYINSMIPVQLDLSGYSADSFSPMWLGLQAGYAIFIGDSVSIEPGLRYNFGFGDAEDANVLQFNVGFAIHI